MCACVPSLTPSASSRGIVCSNLALVSAPSFLVVPPSDSSSRMSKINELIAAKSAAGETFIAFEFFPPRTEAGVEALYGRMERFRAQGAWLAADADVRAERAEPSGSRARRKGR